jgi:hypothetical protein
VCQQVTSSHVYHLTVHWTKPFQSHYFLLHFENVELSVYQQITNGSYKDLPSVKDKLSVPVLSVTAL